MGSIPAGGSEIFFSENFIVNILSISKHYYFYNDDDDDDYYYYNYKLKLLLLYSAHFPKSCGKSFTLITLSDH